MENPGLKDLVQRIINGSCNSQELNRLINLMKEVSLGYLNYQEIIGKRISNGHMDEKMDLADCAIDCIAELFARDEADKFPQLIKYYEPLLVEFTGATDTDVLIWTRRLAVNKTKQELSRIFRERDPEGAKIFRNIRVAIRTSDKLQTFVDLGKEFVFYTNGANGSIDTNEIAEYLRREKPPIPENILYTKFIDIYSSRDNVSACIRKLFKIIDELREYQNYLSWEVTMRLIRTVKLERAKEVMANNTITSLTPLDELENKELETHIEAVMAVVIKKVRSQYLCLGKLGEEKAEAYIKALRDILYDLVEKKDKSFSYFKALRCYMPELSQREYRHQERGIFEYLAKVAKRTFRKILRASAGLKKEPVKTDIAIPLDLVPINAITPDGAIVFRAYVSHATRSTRGSKGVARIYCRCRQHNNNGRTSIWVRKSPLWRRSGKSILVPVADVINWQPVSTNIDGTTILREEHLHGISYIAKSMFIETLKGNK